MRCALAVATVAILATPAGAVTRPQISNPQSVTVPIGAGLPTPLIARGIVFVLVVLAGGLLLIAWLRGRDPAWAAAAGHSLREAAFRLGSSSLLLELPRGSATEAPAPAGAPPADELAATAPPAGEPTTTARSWRPSRALVLVPAGLAAMVLAVVLLSGCSSPAGAENQQSTFQDDRQLLAAPTPAVRRLLGVLSGFGIDHLRVGVNWSKLAPSPRSRARPGFDATDPAAYPASGWVAYDRLVRLARAQGMAVDFDVTGPAPLWATNAPAGTRGADHYLPLPREFGLFVVALGRRYSGVYTPAPGEPAASAARAGQADAGPLPRITRWSVWNEPNRPAALAPQWRSVSGAEIPSAPIIYRAYLNEAAAALGATGHPIGPDTLLIGELAAGGGHTPRALAPMAPMVFLRALYCVDAAERPLHGAPALAIGCPAKLDPQTFVIDNPGLFEARGFAAHPYDGAVGPAAQPSDPDVVTLSSLARLSGGLERIFHAYGQQRAPALYVTTYGPGPHLARLSPGSLDQATYVASRNPGIGSFPALEVRRLPLWVPSPRADRSGKLVVWGQLRFARLTGQPRVGVQWRGATGAYRQIATGHAAGRAGFFTLRVHLPGSGRLRLQWNGAGGRVVQSRSIAVLGRGESTG